MLSWPFRVAGISLAIAQMLLLAVKSLNLRLDHTFASNLGRLNEIVSVSLGLEELEAHISTGLAGLGLEIHPADHWHQLFILLWLLMLIGARNAGIFALLLMAVTAIPCALVTAMAVASVPVDSKPVLLWTGAGLLANFAINGAIVVRTWPALVLPVLGSAIAITGGIVQPGPLSTVLGYDPGVTSTPLLIVAAATVASALVLIAMDTSTDDGTLWESLNDPGAASGVDILTTYAGALALALAFAA
jgi:hypothetical protein